MASSIADEILNLVGDVSASAGEFVDGPIKAECVWLSRKVSLLSHLVEEIREFVSGGDEGSSSSSASASPSSYLGNLMAALEAIKRFLMNGRPQGDGDTVSRF